MTVVEAGVMTIVTSINNLKNKNKIFLVDDELDVSYTISTVLQDNGFEVDAFTDSVLALANYKTNFYDLIILDIKMPGMDGFELCKKIRETDPKVKISFLTASEMFYEEYREARSQLSDKIGEEFFIQKPTKNEELIMKIKEIINS
jgi:CheY-like chemotaxis protein